MCGIVGYVGARCAQDVLLDGLTKLEYRGYDSAGVALETGEAIRVVKTKGRLTALRAKLEQEDLPVTHCGIGHTRWATHGEPSDVNSHPHSTPYVSIVHNGIIENYGALKEMLEAALAYEAGPAALRYPRGRGVGRQNYLVTEPLRWGHGQLLRPGRDLMILAAGPLAYQALSAAAYLEAEGYSVGVWDPCFIKPLDQEGLKKLSKNCPAILTVEENVAVGGFGSQVALFLAGQEEAPSFDHLCLPDDFVEQGERSRLLANLGLDAEGIAAAGRRLLTERVVGSIQERKESHDSQGK